MPGRDGRGPWGQGPVTGRGFGPCGAGSRGFYNYGPRCGLGLGRGFNRQVRAWGYPQQQRGYGSLEEYREVLKQELAWVNRELDKE